jgi:apolipoprotein N-acyltransferase
MNKRLFSLSTLWLVIFGLINLFASGRWTVAAAIWVAPIFGLRYLHVQPKRRRYFYFFLVYWITLAIPWYGATFLFGPAHFVFMAVNALVASIPFFLDSWVAPRLRCDGRLPFIATFTFPLAVTTLEFLISSTNPIGNFGALGYSQYDLPILTQITAVSGMLGLTFLVSWFPAIVNWAWDNGFEWKRVRAGVIAFSAIMLLVLGYGVVRLATAPEIDDQESVPVASFTLVENHMGDLNTLLAEEGLAAYREETKAVHGQYLSMTEQAIADGAKIILWPELAIIGVEEDVQDVVAQGQILASEGGIYLGMPVFITFPDSERPSENKLFVADPDGRIVIEHIKYGGNILEGTLKGNGEIDTVQTPYGGLAGIICWDTNFPNIVRQVGQQHAAILLSPAKEWEGINPMHAEMAVFRAIENGVSLIRQSDEGMSIVVDGYGRTLGTGEGLANSGNYFLVEVPTSGPTTLYPLIGNVVGILATIGLVAMLVYAFLIGRRKPGEAPQGTVTSSEVGLS